MSLPPSLVVIADSRTIAVIAWNINIIMNSEIISFIIAFRAYLLQTPTCTRVNNLAYANALHTCGTPV